MKKEKTSAKEPSHSVASNTWWTFRRLWEYAPGAFVIFAALVPLRLLSRYREIFFPSKTLEVVTAALPFGAAMRPVGILLALLFAAELGTRILSDLSETAPDPYRSRMRDRIMRKHFALLIRVLLAAVINSHQGEVISDSRNSRSLMSGFFLRSRPLCSH